jgi:hypothetical protein
VSHDRQHPSCLLIDLSEKSVESIELNPDESVKLIELNPDESVESNESVESIELNRFAVGQKRKTGTCCSPRSPGCGSRTSTALGWSSTT